MKVVLTKVLLIFTLVLFLVIFLFLVHKLQRLTFLSLSLYLCLACVAAQILPSYSLFLFTLNESCAALMVPLPLSLHVYL